MLTFTAYRYSLLAMKINKITDGFVIQVFDTETGKYLSQNFTAGANVDYENEQGQTLNDLDMKQYNFGPDAASEPYLPFDMVQPTPELSIALKLCREQIQQDLLALCDSGYNISERNRFETIACQIVVDNFKKL